MPLYGLDYTCQKDDCCCTGCAFWKKHTVAWLLAAGPFPFPLQRDIFYTKQTSVVDPAIDLQKIKFHGHIHLPMPLNRLQGPGLHRGRSS